MKERSDGNWERAGVSSRLLRFFYFMAVVVTKIPSCGKPLNCTIVNCTHFSMAFFKQHVPGFMYVYLSM